MASIITKNKIKEAALICFNREGIANTRLQHIADEAILSVGNMTYHFRTKEDIVRAVWEQLVEEQRILLTEFRILPLFEDIERMLASTFELQQRYAFFYQDTLEVMRAYPEIQVAHRQHITWQIQQMQWVLEFNQARGAFRSELPATGQMALLAHQFWMIADTWMYRNSVQGVDTNNYIEFNKTMWFLLYPYFTDMGIREFQQIMALISREIITFEH